MAVAEQPGSHYNPLFIVGGAGLGKTHLLNAVGHAALELYPGCVVRYVSSENFFNEFIDGIRRKRMDEFKHRYRTTDVLLLDDVQFFEGKEQILEEFFHTFNSLYESGKQMVLSSDRAPRHLATLENRLRSRLERGLVTDIQPPDVETRLAILRKNLEHSPHAVPEDVLLFIAEHVPDNVRELQGGAHQSHCLRGADGRAHRPGNGERRPSRFDSNRRSSTAFARGHHLDVGRLLRVHPGRSHRPEQASTLGDGPSDSDVPLPRADQPLATQGRRTLRRQRPHDRPLRGREGETTHPDRQRHIRAGHRLVPP